MLHSGAKHPRLSESSPDAEDEESSREEKLPVPKEREPSSNSIPTPATREEVENRGWSFMSLNFIVEKRIRN